MVLNILAVSDNVLPQMHDAEFLRRTYPDVDLLISCGDMPPSYLDFIGSVLSRPLFFVRGNHDGRYNLSDSGGDNLHMRIKSYRGFTFAGLEGSIRYNEGAVQYTDNDMFRLVLTLMPRLMLMRAGRGSGLDVLVAHSPPLGIHDIPDDYAHRGFKAFLYLIRWARPRYLLHGHIDTWDNRQTRRTVYKDTVVLNINPVMTLQLDQLGPDDQQ